ncbi:uncharacterized protein LOC135830588 [Sycon ciliatum]|uniref:uncharacterized protein LOC135830588 n=1 Tax=Sycon ciliatum TaxID=27933 RepID=UPI0020ADE2F3|eukprot:scpid72179/ scgid14021/ 
MALPEQSNAFEDFEHVTAPSCKSEERVKLVVLGAPGSGKSSFCQRFANDNFHVPKAAQLGLGMVKKDIVKDGSLLSVELWDCTTGRNGMPASLWATLLHECQGMILLLDVSASTGLLDQALRVQEELSSLNLQPLEVPVVHVLSKCDKELCPAVHTAGQLSPVFVVPNLDGAKDQYFLCCSAKLGIGVYGAVTFLLSALRDGEQQQRQATVSIGVPAVVRDPMAHLSGVLPWLTASCADCVHFGGDLQRLSLLTLYHSLRCGHCVDRLTLPAAMQASLRCLFVHLPVFCHRVAPRPSVDAPFWKTFGGKCPTCLNSSTAADELRSNLSDSSAVHGPVSEAPLSPDRQRSISNGSDCESNCLRPKRTRRGRLISCLSCCGRSSYDVLE